MSWWARHLPEFVGNCRQLAAKLISGFWSTFVQKSSSVSAIVLISDADEIPSNVSAPVLISADLRRMSQQQHHHQHRHFIIIIVTTTSAPKPHNDHVVVRGCRTPSFGFKLEHVPRLCDCP